MSETAAQIERALEAVCEPPGVRFAIAFKVGGDAVARAGQLTPFPAAVAEVVDALLVPDGAEPTTARDDEAGLSLHAELLARRLILVLGFSPETSLGLVRLRVKSLARAIEPLLEQDPAFPPLEER
jgi:hypothetical protein